MISTKDRREAPTNKPVEPPMETADGGNSIVFRLIKLGGLIAALTDEIQFPAHDIALVPLGRQTGQRHFDDGIRVNLRIVDVVSGLMDHQNVDLVAARHTVTNDPLALACLAPRRDDDREVFVVFI